MTLHTKISAIVLHAFFFLQLVVNLFIAAFWNFQLKHNSCKKIMHAPKRAHTSCLLNKFNNFKSVLDIFDSIADSNSSTYFELTSRKARVQSLLVSTSTGMYLFATIIQNWCSLGKSCISLAALTMTVAMYFCVHVTCIYFYFWWNSCRIIE